MTWLRVCEHCGTSYIGSEHNCSGPPSEEGYITLKTSNFDKRLIDVLERIARALEKERSE